MLSKERILIHILVALAAATGLAGCANSSADGSQDHGRHHPGRSADPSATSWSGTDSAQGGMANGAMTGSQPGCGMMGGSASGSQSSCEMMKDDRATGRMQHMDKEAVCAMYRDMRDAPTEQARQAMMDRSMQGMSPEMRQQHMDMMRKQCQ